MKTSLILLILGLAGAGLGTAGGAYLRANGSGQTDEKSSAASSEKAAPKKEESAEPTDAKTKSSPTEGLDSPLPKDGPFEYVKMNNQFVVPVVRGDLVRALVILSLSLEVPLGKREAVYAIEPRLRDAILAVLLHHSNAGGFDGHFSDLNAMEELRTAMRNTASRTSKGTVHDVLILDIVRQDVR